MNKLIHNAIRTILSELDQTQSAIKHQLQTNKKITTCPKWVVITMTGYAMHHEKEPPCKPCHTLKSDENPAEQKKTKARNNKRGRINVR